MAEKTKLLKLLITITVMSVAVIEVLDMTIVNVALPHMMGALSANAEQITWVLTSYIVVSGIVMPLNGFLVTRLGQKRLLLIDIIGFLISSILCGFAVNLTQIVIFRTLQGLFGATLVPMSQYILKKTFGDKEQGKAMAIWGIGIMAGPILGPTIGGYITETLSWRWIFFINIPICIMAIFMTMAFIEETPRKLIQIDWFGLILLITGIGSLQIILDRGNQDNWFDSRNIIILSAICAYSLIFFIIRGLVCSSGNIINLKLFTNRNFTLATTLLACYAATVFGILTLLPMMLENLMNYPVDTTGWVMAPRGIASILGMLIMAKFIQKVDSRYLLIFGLLMTILGSWMMTSFNLGMSQEYVIITGAIQGFGMGFFFVPISILALSTLPETESAEGAGLFSFGRSLGSSIGISFFSTILSRQMQTHWNRLGGYLIENSASLQYWLTKQSLDLNNPLSIQLLAKNLNKQAGMLGFVNCYYLGMILMIALIPLIFLIHPPKKAS
jgi:MFS transporter, DHA2 family, multidrug resistance protein